MRKVSSNLSIHASSATRGFALVVVLATLVLLMILVIGFIWRAGTERAAASAFRSSVSTRQLADIAVGLVQGQINLATTQGANVAWTSQPGMVRTFNTSGGLSAAYKLYSAQEMVGSHAGITAGKSNDEPPPTWGADPAVWTDLNAPVEREERKSFPILDPSLLEQPIMRPEGFSIDNAPGASEFQKAPMPVRWLYVLEDGSVVAPTGSGTSISVAGASKDNPIAGRIAFWTDDDSCKVNINTAAEGTYWDTPRGGSAQEVEFANYQPAQKEWQRYPGHPAMTSLSAVFPSLTPDDIYAIVPRVVGGGSNGGTAIASAPLTPDSDRLYASIDEMLFDPNRTPEASLSRSLLQGAKFFLTARSRAPETNLFNLPRVATWPIYRLGTNGLPNMTRTTVFDRLIAFCGSTGEVGQSSYSPYIFQRENYASATNDVAIPRNEQLLAYLRYLTGEAIPGFGGNFSAKYGADRNQILTQIFDYIRSANLQDDTLASNARYTPVGQGIGWVAPTQSVVGGISTQGFGRSYTVSELGLGIISNAVADDPSTPGTDESAGSNTDANPVVAAQGILNAGEMYIQAIMFPEFFSVMQGWVRVNPSMSFRIKGLDTLKVIVNGTEYSLFPNLDSGSSPLSLAGGTMVTGWGGNPSYRAFGLGDSPYPFVGNSIKINALPEGETLMLKAGGSVVVEIYAGNTPGGDPLQTITIDVSDDLSMPLPKIVDKDLSSQIQDASKEKWWSFSKNGGRLGIIGQNPNAGGKFLLQDYDAVRTFLPKHGDYRLVAGRRDVPAGVFVPHPYALSDPSRRIAANLSTTDQAGRLPGIDSRGTYLRGVVYPTQVSPDMPYLDPSDSSTANFWPDLTGDFDTGVSVVTDGPYINKPDEGNARKLGEEVPYFDAAYHQEAGGETFFSPNRLMPSPGMFGSLPTRVLAGDPWQTLLFRPQSDHPADVSHFSGAAAVPDHLLLDFLWMPVVEPYAISDRFSTAGKINMNYQILPFTYIERSTGMRALLKSEKVAAIPKAKVDTYKPPIRESTWENVANANPSFRLAIDADATLSQFEDDRFAQGEVFRSASEICDVHIVPDGESVGSMEQFWNTHALTGENLRERIYTTLYPRLTTRSNTFTVHFRAQALQKAGEDDGTWEEGRDSVRGEYRGSTTIERYINANNLEIPDYAANPAGIPSEATLDQFYKWRVVENREFAP